MVPPTCTLVRLVPAEHGRTGVGVGERAAEKGVGDAFAPNVVVGGHHADVQFAVAELIVEVAELVPAVSVERHIGRRVVAVPGVAPVGHDLHTTTARQGHVVQRQPPPRVRMGRTGRPRVGQGRRTGRAVRCHNIGVDQRAVGVTGEVGFAVLVRPDTTDIGLGQPSDGLVGHEPPRLVVATVRIVVVVDQHVGAVCVAVVAGPDAVRPVVVTDLDLFDLESVETDPCPRDRRTLTTADGPPVHLRRDRVVGERQTPVGGERVVGPPVQLDLVARRRLCRPTRPWTLRPGDLDPPGEAIHALLAVDDPDGPPRGRAWVGGEGGRAPRRDALGCQPQHGDAGPGHDHHARLEILARNLRDVEPVGRLNRVDPRRNVHIVHGPGGLLGHLDQFRRGGHLAFRAVEDEPVTVAVSGQLRHYTTLISGMNPHRHPAWSPGYRP